MKTYCILLLLLLSPAAFGQQSVSVRRAPGPIRDAGTYHVATGTWTRGAGQLPAISPDHIYRNDASSGYFGVGWEGCWTMEEIVLPGPDHPKAGPQTGYLIDGFTFAYCKNGAGTVDWVFGLYDGYVPCDDPTSPTGCLNEVRLLTVPGLPGGSACWSLTVDLGGGYETCLEADGGSCAPGYQGSGSNLDHGAIGFGWLTTDGGTSGPVLAGEPTWVPAGEGTCYDPSFTNSCMLPMATGLGAQDLFGISNHDPLGSGFVNCAFSNGCFFGSSLPYNVCGPAFGPFASFEWGLFADCTTWCTSGGGSVSLYCDEAQNPNNYGDIAIDTVDSGAASIVVTLSAPQADGQLGYLLVGDGDGVVSQPPGAVGDLCILGGSCVGRYDKDPGTISGGMLATDLRNALSNPCGGAAIYAPGTTWRFQYWHQQPMGQQATFSGAMSVTFQ